MKKIGLLFLLVTVGLWGQDTNPGPASAPSTATGEQSTPQGSISTSVTFPTERVQTPTYADLYCAGFISKQPLPNADFVAGGVRTPNTTQFPTPEIVYLAGNGYQNSGQHTLPRR